MYKQFIVAHPELASFTRLGFMDGSNLATNADDNTRYKVVLGQLDAIDAAGAADRAKKLLVNLGFSAELLGRTSAS